MEKGFMCLVYYFLSKYEIIEAGKQNTGARRCRKWSYGFRVLVYKIIMVVHENNLLAWELNKDYKISTYTEKRYWLKIKYSSNGFRENTYSSSSGTVSL